MLKVVGASWYKTRLSTYILLGALILAVCGLFLAEMERPTFDGTYCATAYWTRRTGLRIEYWGQVNDLSLVAKGAARTCYKDTTLENGWSQIEIETQSQYPDYIQAFSAGVLEGALTWSNIYHHWSNTIQSFCEKDDQSQTFCTWLRDTISTNIENVKKTAEEKTDHYSYQIRLFYHQLEGLERGFNKGVKRARSDWEIPSSDFLLLNSAADIRDLKVYYENIVLKNDNQNMTVEQPKGTMVFRILEQEGLVKALFGHSSSGSYSAMLRMIKKYRFYYHFSSDPNSHLVPGINITFTGYPGIISSADDFYMITGKHSQLTVGGIGIWNENVDLWDNVDLDKSVLLSARLMAANRLAHGGRTWSKIMARDPSFGSKQWIVLDNKRLHHLSVEQFNSFNTTSNKTVVKQGAPDNYNFNESPPEDEILNAHKGIIWIADQLPGRLHAEDMTGRIIKKGFWIGSGRPWFNEILDLSLIKDEEEVESMEEIDSISEIDSVIKALKRRAFRGDLDDEHEKAFGNIDAKAFSETNSGDVEFQALAGPLYHREIETPSALSLVSENYTEPEFHPRKLSKKIDIFKWSKSNLNVKHDGHPDVWDFGKVTPKWAWST